MVKKRIKAIIEAMRDDVKNTDSKSWVNGWADTLESEFNIQYPWDRAAIIHVASFLEAIGLNRQKSHDWGGPDSVWFNDDAFNVVVFISDGEDYTRGFYAENKDAFDKLGKCPVRIQDDVTDLRTLSRMLRWLGSNEGYEASDSFTNITSTDQWLKDHPHPTEVE